MQTIKDILNLIRQVVKAMTNIAEEAEALTQEIVMESEMIRFDMAEDRKIRKVEIETASRAAMRKAKKAPKKK